VILIVNIYNTLIFISICNTLWKKANISREILNREIKVSKHMVWYRISSNVSILNLSILN